MNDTDEKLIAEQYRKVLNEAPGVRIRPKDIREYDRTHPGGTPPSGKPDPSYIPPPAAPPGQPPTSTVTGQPIGANQTPLPSTSTPTLPGTSVPNRPDPRMGPVQPAGQGVPGGGLTITPPADRTPGLPEFPGEPPATPAPAPAPATTPATTPDMSPAQPWEQLGISQDDYIRQGHTGASTTGSNVPGANIPGGLPQGTPTSSFIDPNAQQLASANVTHGGGGLGGSAPGAIPPTGPGAGGIGGAVNKAGAWLGNAYGGLPAWGKLGVAGLGAYGAYKAAKGILGKDSVQYGQAPLNEDDLATQEVPLGDDGDIEHKFNIGDLVELDDKAGGGLGEIVEISEGGEGSFAIVELIRDQPEEENESEQSQAEKGDNISIHMSDLTPAQDVNMFEDSFDVLANNLHMDITLINTPHYER